MLAVSRAIHSATANWSGVRPTGGSARPPMGRVEKSGTSSVMRVTMPWSILLRSGTQTTWPGSGDTPSGSA